MDHENGNARNGCPHVHVLEKWIACEEPKPELESHLRSCHTCQNSIESLTDSQFLSEFKPIAKRKWGHRQVFMGDGDGHTFPVIDGFEIDCRIGTGGMGVVYKAHDDNLKRTVALKVLTNVSNSTAAARFEREAKSLSRLDHPNVVSVYSSGMTENGDPYFAMAFVDGISLKQELASGTISPKRAVEITAQIARGLHEAHRLGLVHRDVKPSNILLDSRLGTAQLIDFGLVRDQQDETLTREDIICGSPEYMSPEQSLGYEKADQRSDVYSLGVSLFETLTGTVPFRGRPLNVIEQHRHHDPIPPTQLNRGVPADVENICLKALEKVPAKRYQNAKLFADDLQRFLDDRPVSARPISGFQKLRRWAERNPKLAAVSSLFVSVLILATGLVTWQWLAARNHRMTAEKNFLQAQRNFDFATEQVLNKTRFGDRLRSTPGHEIAARDLYRQLVTEIDRLSQLRTHDANILSIRPILYQSLASQECQVGDAADSIELFRQSIELTKELAPETIPAEHQGKSFSSDVSSPTPNQQQSLSIAMIRFQLGEALLQTGRADEALSELHKARKTFVSTLSNVSAEHQDWIRRTLVLSLVTESQAWLAIGNAGRAEQCFQDACANLPDYVMRPTHGLTKLEETFWLEPGTENENGGEVDAVSVSSCLAHTLGRFYVDESAADAVRFWQGMFLLHEALESRRFIGQAVPSYPFWKRNVALTLMELAKGYSQVSAKKDADLLIEESVQILEELENDSNNLSIRFHLARALLIRSEFRVESEPELAKYDLEKAALLCVEVLSVSPQWHECQFIFFAALNAREGLDN